MPPSSLIATRFVVLQQAAASFSAWGGQTNVAGATNMTHAADPTRQGPRLFENVSELQAARSFLTFREAPEAWSVIAPHGYADGVRD